MTQPLGWRSKSTPNSERPNDSRQLAELDERLTERDREILRDLERFRLLTTRHIQRLHVTDGHSSLAAATRACTRELARLVALGVITAINEQRRRKGGARRGSDLLVWQLTDRGAALLRYRRGEKGRKRYLTPSPEFVKHTLAVAGLGVGLREATQQGIIGLAKLAVEHAAHRSYVGPHGKTALKPDLHAITTGPDAEVHFFVEADLSTERGPHLQRKLEAYHRYHRTGRYEAEHGLFPYVLWVVPDQARVRQLSRLIGNLPSSWANPFHIRTFDQFIDFVVAKTLDDDSPTPPDVLDRPPPSTE